MFPIEFRMSGSELFEGGYDLEEGVRIAQAVEEYVDLIHVSAGSYQFGFFKTHPSMFSEHGVNVYLAEEIKKHVKKPVATIGALNDPEQMEEIIASGKADVVYMGRALLADPYLPQKVVSGNDDQDREMSPLLYLHGGAPHDPDQKMYRQPPDRKRDRGNGSSSGSCEKESSRCGRRRGRASKRLSLQPLRGHRVGAL